ncbi:glycosyltransferase [Lacisediminihabitans changchengi]|uniref:Glycosyltransferase n=1 Tax=Lacisediminihabitans changchengi TaxID=2787634 RepID=A0A934SMB9_9MICO|nr:glycosyltransferase family 2 protein [Lacisediminihabitans changchengi]MBK4346699.1 glycosyltransferase [Lacisediminihabitans changchengi]MBK4348178.1 glycosyltransferase [Lacisediminihabitans changchengi]
MTTSSSEAAADAAAPATLDATVIIPTLDGDRYLAEVLDILAQQDFAGTYEVLVIDSGSTDATLSIVRDRPWVRLHQIPNAEFGHGRTRNLGARLASGRLLAYLSQDAIPGDRSWLARITEPLDPAGVNAVAVVGLQVPRPSCFPLLKYEIDGVFAAIGPADRVTVVERGDAIPEEEELDRLAFYSDVNSATRREFLLDVIPYQDVLYSEDFAFGKDVILAGYRKAYAPAGFVVHSNDLTLREYRKRVFEETISRRRVGNLVPPVGVIGAVLRAGYGGLRDVPRIVRDADYSARAKLGWLLRNPLYHAAKWLSIHSASTLSLDDHARIARGSLEAERKPDRA